MSNLDRLCGLGLSLVAFSLSAEEPTAAGNTQLPKLEGAIRLEQRAGHETIQHACFSLGANRFAFVVPPGFRIDTTTADKVVLVNNDLSCLISVRIVTPTSLEAQREDLLTHYPDAKIVDESSVTAASQSGPVFDWLCNTAGVARSGRVAFIPSPAGVLEFTLLTSPSGFRSAQADFNFLLQTLRTSDATRELKIIQFAGQS